MMVNFLVLENNTDRYLIEEIDAALSTETPLFALVGQVANSIFSTSVVLTRTTTTGNSLVLCVQHQGGTVVSVVDTATNTWVKDADTLASNTALGQGRVDIWHCANATSITSVTITGTGTSALIANLSEWTGMDTTTPVRATNTSYSGATSASQAATTVTATAGDLVICILGYLPIGGNLGRADTIVHDGFQSLTGGNVSSSFVSVAWHLAAGTEGASWTYIPSAATRGAATVAFAPLP